MGKSGTSQSMVKTAEVEGQTHTQTSKLNPNSNQLAQSIFFPASINCYIYSNLRPDESLPGLHEHHQGYQTIDLGGDMKSAYPVNDSLRDDKR